MIIGFNEFSHVFFPKKNMRALRKFYINPYRYHGLEILDEN